MRGSWEDFTSKYGFQDGDGADGSDFQAREKLVKLLNDRPEMRAAKLTAVGYDHPGLHNPYLILLLANPEDKKPAELVADWAAGIPPLNPTELPELEVDIEDLIDEAYAPNKPWTYAVVEMYGGNCQDVYIYQDEDQESCEIAAKALARILVPNPEQDSERDKNYDSSQCDSEVYVDLVPDVLRADEAQRPPGSTRVLTLAA